MLTWFRVHASAVASALLAMAVLGGPLAATHHDDCHDAACAITATAHDASAHQFRAADPALDAHPLHCLACHSLRAFRAPLASRIVTAPASDTGARINVETFALAPAAPLAQPPLRSPPASTFA